MVSKGAKITAGVVFLLILAACASGPPPTAPSTPSVRVEEDPVANANKMLEEGKQTFRYDTFGSEAFWGDQLKLHQAIEGSRAGGVGPGISPKQALALGLK